MVFMALKGRGGCTGIFGLLVMKCMHSQRSIRVGGGACEYGDFTIYKYLMYKNIDTLIRNADICPHVG